MLKRILIDFRYIIMNLLINKIPCWTIRKLFYKLFGLKIGKNSRIGIGTIVVSPKHISIGENSVINEYVHLDGRGGLIIGDNVSISTYVKIITASHNPNSTNFEYVKEKTIINENVWIGTAAIILNNSIISKNTVIGAGCVFKGTSEHNGIYVGNPAKKIKERTKVTYEPLKYKAYFK